MAAVPDSRTSETRTPDPRPRGPHALMPASTHDEEARFGYVVALKSFIHGHVEKRLTKLVDEKVTPLAAAGGELPDFRPIEKRLRGLGVYRTWQAMTYDAQELMWRTVGQCVERQLDDLKSRSAAHADAGSVRIAPDFVPPPYAAGIDIHIMPGGYAADRGGDDVFQGAVFDKAASLYHMGRNGGELNDVRGHTVVQHVFERFPDLQPKRILDMGCTVGHSTVAYARAFPDAEIHAIDIGGALLRYARARAASLGANVHFSLQNAEATDFESGSFDLVVSTAMMHETSNKALPRIIAESKRLLRPGGVMVHLEVPARAENGVGTTWTRIRGLFEAHYNNEPFWLTAQSADIAGMARASGVKDVEAGYQDAVQSPDRARSGGWKKQAGAVHSCWYIVSGRG